MTQLIQPILLQEPAYTKGSINTVFWTSGSNPSGLHEFLLERSSTSNFYDNTIVTNESITIEDESQSTSGTTLVYTSTSPEYVRGVYLESDAYKLVNYFTSGSGFVCNEIRLATPVPDGMGPAGGQVQVIIDYTRSGWTPQAYDSHYNLENATLYYYRVKSRGPEQVASLTSGTYYVYSTQDSVIDSLKMLSPTGKEFWRGGTTQKLLWKADDFVSGLDDTKTLIEYSTDSGVIWSTLVEGSVIPNETSIVNETQSASTTHKVYTTYEIKNITSVYPINVGSGTNWFYHPLASGTSSFHGKEISLDYPLPSASEQVLVTYKTYGQYDWNVPTNLDGQNWRMRFTVQDNVGNKLMKSLSDDFVVLTPIDTLPDVFLQEQGTNTSNLLNTFGDSIDSTNKNAVFVESNLYFDNSYGTDLDIYATSFGLTRFTDEPDYELRERIKHEARIANTKLAMIDYLDNYSASGSNDLQIQEWVGAKADNDFFLDYSYLDYTDRITSGTMVDPFSFDVWIRPKSYDAITYKKIADAITKTRPATTKAYVRVLSGEAYGSFAYGTGHKYGASTF